MKRNWLLLIFLFIFCNELPIGEEEINLRGDFTAQYLELSPYLTLTESKNIALGLSSNLIVGKNDEYESRIILKFVFPDSFEPGYDEIKLILRRNDNLTNSELDFSIHLLTESFEENEATWSKRTSSDLWANPGGDFEDEALYEGQISGDSLIIFFNYLELNQIESADGIIIIPEDTGFCGIYSRHGSLAPDFFLVKNDVTTSIPAAADCHILIGPEPLLYENWIGSGMAYRNYVKFILDPVLENNLAVFAELTFRPAQHFGMRDTIEIGIKELQEPLDDFDTPVYGSFISLKKFAIDDTLFRVDIVKHVQRIIDHPDSNFGFFIILSPENYDISNLQIEAGSHRLNIGYITPPDIR